MKEFNGRLKGFPPEVIELMLIRQHEVWGKTDIKILENSKYSGFIWSETPEGVTFWDSVTDGEFKRFYKKYPKGTSFNSRIFIKQRSNHYEPF